MHKKQEPKTVSIYALLDPKTKQVRYVGVTRFSLARRLGGHIQSALKANSNLHVHNWIRKINRKPIIQLIEIVSFSVWAEKEIWWIAYYKSQGCKLTNSTIGGEGACGTVPSKAARRRRSEFMKGNTRRKRGTKSKASTKKKISKSLIGNKRALGYRHTEESKAKIAEAIRKRAIEHPQTHTAKTKRKLSKIRREHAATHPYKHTAAIKAQIAEIATERWKSEEYRKKQRDTYEAKKAA